MKKIAVTTAYDTNGTVIGYVIPKRRQGVLTVTTRTYNKLLAARTVGGDAGLVFHASEPFFVWDEKYECIR